MMAGRRNRGLCIAAAILMAAVAAGPCGYFGYRLVQRIRVASAIRERETRAAGRIEGLGGHVTWDHGVVTCVDLPTGAFPRAMVDILPELAEVKVIYQRIDVPSDPAIEELGRLPSLPQLDFSGPAITDSTVRSISHLSALAGLCLSQTKLTDESLGCLVALRKLEHLDIDYAPVSDAGLSHLSGLRSLRSLSLNGADITDAGLPLLKHLDNLRTLRLYNCKRITKKGVQDLRLALPHTKIGWDKQPLHEDID
jgi:hypothetical protein